MSVRVKSTSTTKPQQVTYPNSRKVFVGNVPFNCSTEQLQNCFNTLEGFITADVIRRYGSHLSRGFGFVVFSTDEQAQSLLASTDPVTLDGRELRLSVYGDKPANSSDDFNNSSNRSTKPNTFKIFVDNLDTGTTDEELSAVFIAAAAATGPATGSVLSTFVNCNGNKSTAVVIVDSHELFKNLLNEQLVFNDTVLSTKPFRQQTKSKDPRAVYKDGFQAGQVVGFQEGFQKGLAHLVVPSTLSRSKAGSGSPPAPTQYR